MHTITWTVDHFGVNGEIRCRAPQDAECRLGCEPCLHRGVDNCTHPKVDMGRCLATEQIHDDEVAESYGADKKAVIQDADIVVYQRHGAWLWEYADAEVA